MPKASLSHLRVSSEGGFSFGKAKTHPVSTSDIQTKMPWLQATKQKLRQHPDTWALLLLTLAIVVFHWRGLQPGYTFLPVDLAGNLLPWRDATYHPLHNSLISDPLYEFYPFLAYAVDTVQSESRWPLWNHSMFVGHPAFADPLMQVFYPVPLLFGLGFGAGRGFALGIGFHVLLAAGGLYAYLRSLRCQPVAALAGAFTYALSGHFITWLEASHRIATMAWLPLTLWLLELSLQKRDLRLALLGSLSLTMAILGGQYQYVLTFGLFLAAYILGRSWMLRREDWYRPLGHGVVLAGLTAWLSSFQLFAFREFLELSQRAEAGDGLSFLPPGQLLSLFSANFFGSPVAAAEAPYWGTGLYSEHTIYAGLIALILSGWAVWQRRDFLSRYLAGLILVSVYVIIGLPGASWLMALPGLSYVSPLRATFILPLLLAIMAALGLDQLPLHSNPVKPLGGLVVGVVIALSGPLMALDFARLNEHRDVILPVIGWSALLLSLGLVLLAATYVKRWRKTAGWLLLGLLFIDLYSFGSRYNPVGPVQALMPPTPVSEFLQQSLGQERFVAQQTEVLFGPNVPGIYGLNEAGGYASLNEARYRRLVLADGNVNWWMQENSNVIAFTEPSDRLRSLLQARMMVSPELREDPGIRAEVVQGDCTGTPQPLEAGQMVSETFRVEQTAINRLDLWLQPTAIEGETVSIRLQLWQGERLVLEQQLGTADIPADGPTTVYFAPETTAGGQVYRWQLDSPEEASGLVLCRNAAGETAFAVYGSEFSLVHHSGRVFVYDYPGTLPRAYVVYAAETITDEAATVQRLLSPEFDPWQAVITNVPMPLPASTEHRLHPAEIVLYANNEVQVQAETDRPAILVLGDLFYPGWQAVVNGEPVPIHRVNHVFRGVLLPPGENQVTFTLQPASLRYGLPFSALGLGVVLLGLLVRQRQN